MSIGHERARVHRRIREELLPRVRALVQTTEAKARVFFAATIVSCLVVLTGLIWAAITLRIAELGVVEFVVLLATLVVLGATLQGLFHLIFVRGARRHYHQQIVIPLMAIVDDRTAPASSPDWARREFERSNLSQLPTHRLHTTPAFTLKMDNGNPLYIAEVEAVCRVSTLDDLQQRKRESFAARGLFFAARIPGLSPGTTAVAPSLRRFTNAEELPRATAPPGLKAPPIRPAESWPQISWLPDNDPHDLHAVEIADPEFRAYFDVWSDDTARARALLRSPARPHLKRTHTLWRADAHRSAITRTEGQGYFLILWRDETLYLYRPTFCLSHEMQAFDLAEQARLMAHFAQEVRLCLDLMEVLVETASNWHGRL